MRIITSKNSKLVAKRMQAVRLYNQIGLSRAARETDVSRSTLWRWSCVFAANGAAGLQPHYQRSGRRSRIEGIKISAAALRELEMLVVQTGSRKRAWRDWQKSRACPKKISRLCIQEMPAPLARLVKLTSLQVRCFASADGRRLFLKLPANKTGGDA
jgi:hypothetical protein